MDAAEAISLGRQARKESDLSKARECYAAAASVYQQENDVLAYAHTIRHIADIYLDESKFDQAKPLYERLSNSIAATSIRNFLILPILCDPTRG